MTSTFGGHEQHGLQRWRGKAHFRFPKNNSGSLNIFKAKSKTQEIQRKRNLTNINRHEMKNMRKEKWSTCSSNKKSLKLIRRTEFHGQESRQESSSYFIIFSGSFSLELSMSNIPWFPTNSQRGQNMLASSSWPMSLPLPLINSKVLKEA